MPSIECSIGFLHISKCGFPLIIDDPASTLHVNRHFTENSGASGEISNDCENDNSSPPNKPISGKRNNDFPDISYKSQKKQKYKIQTTLDFSKQGELSLSIDGPILQKSPFISLRALLVCNSKFTGSDSIEKRTDIAAYCSPDISSYAKGWGCGYRNLQIILSTLMTNDSIKNQLEANLSMVPFDSDEKTFRRNSGPDHSKNKLLIRRLQEVIHYAWSKGYDPEGARILFYSVMPRKWIGATEVATVLKFLGVKVEIADFGKEDEIEAFLYFQHQGHSRTIIGIERLYDGTINLLVYEASFSLPQELKNNRIDFTISQSNNLLNQRVGGKRQFSQQKSRSYGEKKNGQIGKYIEV
ncbi:hypothetical protein HK096_004295 [Nowakowskiella sp. JEL0078]|nr:hypothetical protein HK096_004295 [Nowakowskiella sp. JEL0078]